MMQPCPPARPVRQKGEVSHGVKIRGFSGHCGQDINEIMGRVGVWGLLGLQARLRNDLCQNSRKIHKKIIALGGLDDYYK